MAPFKGLRAVAKLLGPEGRESIREAGSTLRSLDPEGVDPEVLNSGDRKAILAAMKQNAADATPADPGRGFSIPPGVLIKSVPGRPPTRRRYEVLVPGERPLLRIEQPPQNVVDHLAGRLVMAVQWDISMPGGPVSWQLRLEDKGWMVLRTAAGDEVGRFNPRGFAAEEGGEILVPGMPPAQLRSREGAQKSNQPDNWLDLDVFDCDGREIGRLLHGTEQPAGGIVMESEGGAGAGDPHDAAFYRAEGVPPQLATMALMAAFDCVRSQWERNHIRGRDGLA